jgi:N-carbamoylputrescine amidase
VANGLPVICVNRVGVENDINHFWGHSFVAGCQGEILAQAGTEPEVLSVAIDPNRTETVRRAWPYLRDRRIDAYQDLLLRFRDGKVTTEVTKVSKSASEVPKVH